MNVILELKHGPDESRKVWVRKGHSCAVGRTERSDVAFPDDSSMSSRHFEIDNSHDGCRIRDCGSTNGTYVNGERIVEAVLQEGDTVTAGQTEFLVRFDAHAKSEIAQPIRHAPPAAPRPASIARVTIELPKAAKPKLPLPPESTPVGERNTPREPAPQSVSVPASGTDSSIRSTTPLARVEQIEEEDIPELLVIDNATNYPCAALPWENARGEGRLTIVLKTTLSLTSSPQAVEEQLPLLISDEPFDKDDPSLVRMESDLVAFKPRADIIVVGHVHAPGQRPVSQLDARLRVGNISKTIRVFGDRTWSFPTAVQLVPRMSKPEPFTAMELTYARAFGGFDESAARYCSENLAGVGFIGQLSSKSIHNKPLPNFEDPHNLIEDWETHPRPQGFGFYGRGWMPRLKFAGTFDGEYLKHRSPLPPEDASHAVNNGAHPDLQVNGYLRGDEEVELENLSPKGNLRFQLPGIHPRIAITRTPKTDESGLVLPPIVEAPVSPSLDTLVLLPDDGVFYLVYRAVFAIPSLDEIDVSRIHITCARQAT